MTDITWTQEYSAVTVTLTTEELQRSLQDVPRSVSKAAIEQFLEDVDRFCGTGVAQQVAKRLGAEGPTSD